MSRRSLIVGVVIALLAAGFLASPVAPAQPADAGTLKTLTPGKAAVTGPWWWQPAQGAQLHAATSGWKPSGVKFSYQWYANQMKIKGATHPTYTVTAATACELIQVSVTGFKTGYRSTTVTSSRTHVIVGRAFGGRPTVTGTAVVGQRLTVTAGSLTPKPQALAATWYRGSTRVATGASYLPSAADAGQHLRVVVAVTPVKTSCLPHATFTVQTAAVAPAAS